MKTTEIIYNGVKKLSNNIWNSKGYKVANTINFDDYKLTDECIDHLRDIQDERLNGLLELYEDLQQKSFEMACDLVHYLHELHTVEESIKFINDSENYIEID